MQMTVVCLVPFEVALLLCRCENLLHALSIYC
jgi:hypothetical protein